MLHSVARDFVPRRFGPNVDVHGDGNAWVVIQRTCWNPVDLAAGMKFGHGTTALRAEASAKATGFAKGVELFFPSSESQALARGDQLGRCTRTCFFAAQ